MMTLQEALEQIKHLMPYYSQAMYYKNLSDVWAEQCMKYAIPDPPEVLGVITSSDVYQLFGAIFPQVMSDPNRYLKLMDGEFQITYMDEIRRFVKWDRTNYLELGMWLDCDDSASHLWGDFACPGWSGLPVFLIIDDLYNGHVFCSVIAYPSKEERTPRVYFLEPQNDLEIAEEMVSPGILTIIMSH